MKAKSSLLTQLYVGLARSFLGRFEKGFFLYGLIKFVVGVLLPLSAFQRFCRLIIASFI